MANIHLTVKVMSSFRRHGESQLSASASAAFVSKASSEVKPKKKRRSTPSVEVTGSIQESGVFNKEGVSPTRKNTNPVNYVPTDYKTSTAPTRSAILIDEVLDEDLNFEDKVNMRYYALMALYSFDYHQAKLDYKAAKDAINKKYVALSDGKVLSPELSIEMSKELHEHSFTYWRHQITLYLWSEEEFEGATYNESKGVWILATTSKSCYTSEALTSEQLDSLMEGTTNIPKEAFSPRAKARIKEIKDGEVVFRLLRKGESLDDYVEESY